MTLVLATVMAISMTLVVLVVVVAISVTMGIDMALSFTGNALELSHMTLPDNDVKGVTDAYLVLGDAVVHGELEPLKVAL